MNTRQVVQNLEDGLNAMTAAELLDLREMIDHCITLAKWQERNLLVPN